MSMIHKNIILLQRGIFRYNYFNPITSLARFINAPAVNNSEQIEFIKAMLEKNELESNWLNLKNNVLCKRGHLNEKNIDAVLLRVMVTNKKFNAALSFANFLKLSNQDLSLGIINSILNLYYECSKEYELSESEKEFILNAHTNLYNKYKVLDNVTCEKLLHALCSINEWKKCMRLLDDILLIGTPTHSAYSTLIGTLFKNNKKIEAMKMIDKSLKNRRPLQHYAYDEWMKYIFRKYKDKKTILKYLTELCNHITSNCTVVPEETAHRLMESFESLNWIVELTEINKHSGQCKRCNQTLNCLTLSQEEFMTLQKNVKEKLIVGSDLFIKTSPEELKRFMNFVERTAPYDIVLDALNIAYTSGKGDVTDKLRVLTVVINYFLQKNKRILLIGRKHMLRWKRGSLFNLIERTENFFTEDISQDDPYFITAAILSSPNTDIVSRDLLRGHRFVLQNDELRQLFQRWQWQHQWMVFANKNNPKIQAPLKYTPIAQQNNYIWHLPYEAENVSNLGQVNDGIPDSSNWLCMRPKQN